MARLDTEELGGGGEGAGRLRLSLSDTGIGIPEENSGGIVSAVPAGGRVNGAPVWGGGADWDCRSPIASPEAARRRKQRVDGAGSLGRLFNDIAAAAAASDWRRIDALTARLDQSVADLAGAVASYR